MTAQKKAFTLLELIIVISIIAIIAVVAVPRLNFAIISKQDSASLAAKITTDLRRTRRLSLWWSKAVN